MKQILFPQVKKAKFVDAVYPDEDISDLIGDIHPRMVTGAGELGVIVFKISFSYSTMRGNEKKGYKYIYYPENSYINYLEKEETFNLVKVNFLKQVRDFNIEFPYRKMLDVKGVEIDTFAKGELTLGGM